MIQAAFQNNLWSSAKTVNLPTKAFPAPAGEPFTQIQANFALFWGLAIQLYEATLVSDNTPFDRFQLGNQNALSLSAQKGLTTFDDKCAVCHSGSEFTSASVGSTVAGSNPVVFTNNTTHSLIQQSQTNIVGAISDTGFFNIGVRATSEDPGRGGTAPFVNTLTNSPFPLSFSRLAKLEAGGQLPFASPQLPLGVQAAAPDAVQGSFKTPGLRNVELTAPYFHNGSVFNLDDVVLFYARGGNFTVDAAPVSANPELAFAMTAVGSGKLRANQVDVAAFLQSLTDERVRAEKAPFDHPQLQIPSGDVADTKTVLAATGGPLTPVLLQTLTLDPVTTPTTLSGQLLSGTVDDSATVAVTVNVLPPVIATVGGTVAGVAGGIAQAANAWSVNLSGLALGDNSIAITATSTTGDKKTVNTIISLLPVATISGAPPIVTRLTGATMTVGGAGIDTYQFKLDNGPFSADTPVATPIALSGLADGTHTVAVLGRNAAKNLSQPAASPTIALWTVKANPPVLTLKPVASPTNKSRLTISGTVDLALIPQVLADTSVTIGAVTSSAGVWSCQISGFKPGINNLSVTATDAALNTTTKVVGITYVKPDGDLKGSGTVEIADALKALRIAVGVVQPTADDLLHGDVAPLDADGVPAPDNQIDVLDAVMILKKAIGLVKF
jgi:cytochrome c peroxidase